jgi:7-dehydrocholesterol reductase
MPPRSRPNTSPARRQRTRAASPSPPKDSPSPSKKASAVKTTQTEAPKKDGLKMWYAEKGKLRIVIDNYLLPMLLMIASPLWCLATAYITSLKEPSFSSFYTECVSKGVTTCGGLIFAKTWPTAESVTLLAVFNFMALLIYWWPGKTEYGPLTEHGEKPEYMVNGVAHCILFTASMLAGSEYGLGWFQLSVLAEHAPATIGTLNIFGLLFCALLYFKGLYFPSGPDSGTAGHGPVFDYYWGTELYPRFGGVDVKKFVNCRFSMTYWMVFGISCLAKTYNETKTIDPGLFFCALSQFLYLNKFYMWAAARLRRIETDLEGSRRIEKDGFGWLRMATDGA